VTPKEIGLDVFELPRLDDYRAIGRILTRIENGELDFDIAITENSLYKSDDKIVVGVTGGSGVGKSTFINSLIGVALSNKRKIAVLAIDPMSGIDKGTFLGDRLRFDHSFPGKGVFIRSISSSGASNDVPESITSMLNFLRAIGYNFLIVETVGVGQADAQIKKYIDKLIYLPSADLEDWVQALKNEALINADVIFVNDRSGDGEKRLMNTVSQVIESRFNKKRHPNLILGNAKGTLEVNDVYNFLEDTESR
jgi:LAO/AO transport system kinase